MRPPSSSPICSPAALPPPLASSGRLLQIRRLKLELRPWWPGADGAAGGSRAAAARGGAEAWRAGRRRPWEAAGCAAGQQRRRGGARRGKPWRLGDAQRRPWSGSSSPCHGPGGGVFPSEGQRCLLPCPIDADMLRWPVMGLKVAKIRRREPSGTIIMGYPNQGLKRPQNAIRHLGRIPP